MWIHIIMHNRFYPGGWRWPGVKGGAEFQTVQKVILDVEKLKQGLLEVEQDGCWNCLSRYESAYTSNLD